VKRRRDKRGGPEGVTDVAVALACGQRHLRPCRPHPPKRVQDRTIEPLGDVTRLVEPASEPPPWMKRYGHDDIASRQHACSGPAHHFAERVGERSSSFVLQRMNDVAQRAFVSARGHSYGDVRARPWCEGSGGEGAEADRTDTSTRGSVERDAARCA